jgi:dipeptidyl aminopeptidase/acylaminoacyl peptidase
LKSLHLLALSGAALLAAPLAAPLAAQTPFTVDDMLRVEDVSQPEFAPDGESIAYVVTAPGDGDTTQSDIWMVNWDGSNPRPIYPTIDRDEANPVWSADGSTFAFLRSGPVDSPAAQLWASRNGEPPRQVTTLAGGVEEFTLSPDGSQAVVVSEVGTHVTAEVPEVAPPIVLTRFTLKEDGRGWLDDRRKQLLRVDMALGDATQITEGDYDNWMPAWSPDGQWIAFSSRRCERRDRSYCADVYIVSPQGGEPRRISTFADADAEPSFEGGGPQWSPDSRQLVWTRAGNERFIWYTPIQPVVADITTGEERQVGWIDRWFYYPRFAPDGEHLLALVEQDRDTWLARISIGSGEVEYLTSGRRFASGFAAASNGRLAVLDGDAVTPAALRTVEARPRTLSPQNAWLASRTLLDVQDVSWISDGTEVHGMLLLPPGHADGEKHPLVVRLHGGPVYQFSHEFMADWQVFAQSGYAVLAVNPRGSSGRGASFAQEQMARWGGPDVADVSAGITHVIGMGVADPDAIGVGGWSYGGILSNYMIASDPRVKAAVAGAGIANMLGGYGVDQYAREYELELGLPWVETQRWMDLSYPFLHADRITAPTLYLCGEVDWNVPCTGSMQMYQALRANDVPSTLVVYPGQTHSLVVPSYVRDRMERSLAWYDRWLRGVGAE